MAIFGNFADIPLPDVLSLVGQSRGIFTVRNPRTSHHYQLALDDSLIRSVTIDNIPVNDISEIRSHIIDLMRSVDSDFEFVKSAGLPECTLALPLQEVLLNGLTAVDEITALYDHLPSEDTFFKFTGKSDVYLDTILSEFWEHCGYYLLNGASARLLETQTGYIIDDIRLNLYKLRSLGLITPSRQFVAVYEPVEAQSGYEEEGHLGAIPENQETEDGPIWPQEEVVEEEEAPQNNNRLPAFKEPPQEPRALFEPSSLQTVQKAKANGFVLKEVLGHLQKALKRSFL